MNDKVKILLIDGSLISLQAWQKQYDLIVGSTSIGKHFSYKEYRIKKDIETFGELIVCAPLMMVMDRYREKKDAPVTINAFNRTDEYQQELKARGFRAATTSPHVVKLACDCDTPGIHDLEQEPEFKHHTHAQLKEISWSITVAQAKLMKEAAKELGIKVRLGYNDYLQAGQTFIHLDVTPEYYAPGKAWHHQPHPAVWEKEIIW